MGNLSGFLESAVVDNNSRVVLDFDAIRQAALGNYVHVVFPHVGIMLQGNGHKHQSCPLCGGKDRFRCDDKRGEGTWICSQCGAGNGYTLVKEYTGLDSYETNKLIAGALGIDATSSVSDEQREQWRSQQIEREAVEANDKIQAQADAAAKAMQLWSKGASVDSHEYLTRKQITSINLKQYAGDLLIPMQCGDDLVNIQTIAADGKKLFLSDGRVSGAYHVIGNKAMFGGGVILICEGYATGASIFNAMSYSVPVIVAFNAHNLIPVAQSMREQYPNHRIVVCADDDSATALKLLIADAQKGNAPKPLVEYNTGIRDANTAAEAVNGVVIAPDFGGKEGTDFNDLAVTVGLSAVTQQIASVIVAESAPVAVIEPIAPDVIDYTQTQPPELIRSFPVPILNEIGEWIEGYSRQAQQQITMQGVVGLASVLCSRNYCSTHANTSSLFLMVLGDTGVGKNYIKTGVRKFLMGSGLIDMLSGGGNTSSGAVFTALMESPRHIQITDEIGKQLQTARKQSNGMMAEALNVLVECYSSTDDMVQPKNYSNMSNAAQGKKLDAPKIRVFCPAITILGLATPKQVYENLSTVEIEDGFLNRLVVVDVTLPQKPRVVSNRPELPERFIEWAQSIANPEPTSRTDLSFVDMGYNAIPNQVEVEFDDEADALFFSHLDDMAEREARGEFVLPDLTRRWNENAMRLATCFAVCVNPIEPVITLEIAQWCIVYIEYYGMQFMLNVASKVADSDYHRLSLAIIEQVTKAGSKGLTEHEISRKSRLFASYAPMQRDQAFMGLVRDNRMELVPMKSVSSRGKTRNAWVATEFIVNDNLKIISK